MCLACGSVGCCDSSVGRHAVGHFEATGHPAMRSIEPTDTWGWCYVDEAYLELGDGLGLDHRVTAPREEARREHEAEQRQAGPPCDRDEQRRPRVRPVSRPRTASIIGVTGWCGRALEPVRQRLDRNEPAADVRQEHEDEGEAAGGLGRLASSPTAAENHEIARMKSDSRPMAASHSDGPAVGRKPMAIATPITSAVATRLRIRLAPTWPASTDRGDDRHRAEAIDHAALHVRAHADRGRRRAEQRGQQDHPGTT